MSHNVSTSKIMPITQRDKNEQKLPDKRKRIIGKTTYNISLAYDESGDTLQELFLQIMKEKEAYQKSDQSMAYLL